MIKGLFIYEATSGPDIEYSKKHILQGGEQKALCGLNSSFFEKTLPITSKEEITDEVCKRCSNRVKAMLKAVIPSEKVDSNKTGMMTFEEYTAKAMKPHQLVTHYFPTYTKRQAQYLLLKHTCYPLDPERMTKEIYDLYKEGTDIFKVK